MEYQRQLAALLMELKPIHFILSDSQAETIDSANNMMNVLRSNNPGWRALNRALEEISQCHQVPSSIRDQARRIVESWVPF